MILYSSNDFKIQEFKRILGNAIEIKKGKDLEEVNGTALEVIKYKALEYGNGSIVEDSILLVNGKEVVDIKFNENSLIDGANATWLVSLGYNLNGEIFVYQGVIHGTIKQTNKEGYSFAPYFYPNGTELSLEELENKGMKENFSARKIALMNLKENNYLFRLKKKEIVEWEGEYQKVA